MKHKKTILFNLLLVSIIFSSCDSLHLIKRRYTKGYYFERKKHSLPVSEKNNSGKQDIADYSIKVEQSNEPTQKEVNISPSKSAENSSFGFKSFDLIAKKSKFQKENISELFQANQKTRIKSSEVKKQKIIASEQDRGTPAIFYVLWLIILPPVAVYLHEREFNGKFWFNLIFTLLLITWPIALVHGIIVCFGSKSRSKKNFEETKTNTGKTIIN